MAAHGKSFARREAILPKRVLDTFGPRIARKRAVLVPGSNRDARFHVASLGIARTIRDVAPCSWHSRKKERPDEVLSRGFSVLLAERMSTDG